MEIGAFLYFLLTVPFIYSVIAITNVVGKQVLHWLNRCCATLVGVAVLLLCQHFDGSRPFSGFYMYLDGLSMWMILLVTVLYVATAWMAQSHLEQRHNHAVSLPRLQAMIGRYYALMHLYVWAVYVSLLLPDLGVMWCVSGFLLMLTAYMSTSKFNPTAFGITWKYVLVSMAGLCLAFLGIIVLALLQKLHLGAEQSLSWVYLSENVLVVEPLLGKLSFTLLFFGYGMQLGLAPAQAIRADAYAQNTPLHASLLSGSLMICLIYILMRNLAVFLPTDAGLFARQLCCAGAVLTILGAFCYGRVHHDFKHLLAVAALLVNSIILIAMGYGGQSAATFALLFLASYAWVTCGVFFGAGSLKRKALVRSLKTGSLLMLFAAGLGVTYVVSQFPYLQRLLWAAVQVLLVEF